MPEEDPPTPERKPCVQAEDCEMYGLFALSGALALWQVRYCKADFTACARYRRLTRNEPVPRNLLPNGALLRKREVG